MKKNCKNFEVNKSKSLNELFKKFFENIKISNASE